MKLIIASEAQKQFSKLPKSEQKKVTKKLLVLETFPLSGKKLSGEFSGAYTLRSWPYRIIYSIDSSNQTTTVYSILHRQSAYS